MSSLIIEVCEINDVVKHPNADKLDLITIKGWQVIDRRGLRKPGERIIYIPPDSVLPEYMSDNLNVTQYCAPAYPKKDDGSRDPGSRVRAAKLRGVVSYGLIVNIPEGKDWQVGQDVAKYFGITKWEPPKRTVGGEY